MTPGLEEAREAQRQATDRLIDAIHSGQEAREAVARVEQHARANHWGEMLDATFRRRAT